MGVHNDPVHHKCANQFGLQAGNDPEPLVYVELNAGIWLSEVRVTESGRLKANLSWFFMIIYFEILRESRIVYFPLYVMF